MSRPTRLRQMPAELLRFPCQALKAKVAGFKAPSVNRQEDVLPYSPGWSIKAAVDMIGLLHGNITATVVVINKGEGLSELRSNLFTFVVSFIHPLCFLGTRATAHSAAVQRRWRAGPPSFGDKWTG